MYQVKSRPDLGPTEWSLGALREELARGRFRPDEEILDTATGAVAPLWQVLGLPELRPPGYVTDWSEAPKLRVVQEPVRTPPASVHWAWSVGLWLATLVLSGNLLRGGAFFPGPLFAHGLVGLVVAGTSHRDRSGGALLLLIVSGITIAFAVFLAMRR